MAALMEGGKGVCEPSVKMKKVSLYFVERRDRNRAFPSSGHPALVHGAGRFNDMREESGNHGPKGERRSSGEKGGGVAGREAKRERALVMNGVCGK